VHAVDVLLGRERGQQGLRPRIVVGIVERLHRQLQQDLVAFAARARRQALEVASVRRQREADRPGSLAKASAVLLDPMPSPLMTSATRTRLALAGVSLTGRA